MHPNAGSEENTGKINHNPFFPKGEAHLKALKSFQNQRKLKGSLPLFSVLCWPRQKDRRLVSALNLQVLVRHWEYSVQFTLRATARTPFPGGCLAKCST